MGEVRHEIEKPAPVDRQPLLDASPRALLVAADEKLNVLLYKKMDAIRSEGAVAEAENRRQAEILREAIRGARIAHDALLRY